MGFKKGSMRQGEILIKNGCILTGCGRVFSDGFLHIKNGEIFDLGFSKDIPRLANCKTIDACGRYVLPGFINPHMHFYGALSRGMPVGRMKTFGQVLKKLWWPLDLKLSLDDVYISAMIGGIEAIKSGVTTVFDHHASYGAISGSLEKIFQATSELKLRSSLCFEISDRNGKKSAKAAVRESAEWLELVQAKTENDPKFLSRGMVGLHASMTLSDETLKAASELMTVFDVGAHVHVAEGMEDVADTRKMSVMSPVVRLNDKNILRPKTLAIHCVYVDAKDLDILKNSGVSVVHNPLSNLNNAVGVAPFIKMCAKKIPVAIGTDGMSAGVTNDWRAASFLHKVSEKDAQGGGTCVMNAAWKVAPQIASRAFGLDIGVIRKGAEADVIIIDAMPPTQVTEDNAWWHVIFGAINNPVRTTIIAGDIRMQDFKLIGIDEIKITTEAKKLAANLWKRR